MKIYGLTGGIGSGKSTVAGLLEARGARVIDADEVARAVVEPKRPAFEAIVAHFGDDVIAPDGTLDRAKLAERVFSNREELQFLNSVTHPEVGAEILGRIARLATSEPNAVVFLAIPLLVEAGGAKRYPIEATVVVDVAPDVALSRLVRSRGMSHAQAKARIASQASRADRLKVADYVIDNSGSFAQLEAQVDRVVDAMGWRSS